MITRRAFGLAGVAVAATGRARAAGEDPASAPPQSPEGPAPQLTQARLEALRNVVDAPALAAAAQRRGRRPMVWATGFRMRGASTPVTTGDLWHLGSISKSFLATLVARFVDQGRLGWDDTLGATLASQGINVPGPYRDATFLHLLSHRAGLVNYLFPRQAAASDAADDEPAQRRSFLETAFAQPPVGALGAKTAYSNAGYVAAAAMIEARIGAPWQELMRREVFRPLGLASAGFGAPGRKGRLDQPVGHGLLGEPHRPGEPNDDLPLVIGPAGRIHMSLGDLLTYLAAHRDRTRLLEPASWDQLHTPHFDGEYALGWNLWPDGSFTHDGGNVLWYAVASFNPRTGLVAAAAANDGRRPVWNTVGEAVREAKASV